MLSFRIFCATRVLVAEDRGMQQMWNGSRNRPTNQECIRAQQFAVLNIGRIFSCCFEIRGDSYMNQEEQRLWIKTSCFTRNLNTSETYVSKRCIAIWWTTLHMLYTVSVMFQSDARSRKNNIENVSLSFIAIVLRVCRLSDCPVQQEQCCSSFSMKQTVQRNKDERKRRPCWDSNPRPYS